MPRAPHSMPLLLLLLLLSSLPQAQPAFPQDPTPLLTSDLQGECSTHFAHLGGVQVENEREARSQNVPSLREAKRMAKQRGTNRWDELEPHASHPWAFLHSEVVLLGG